jgi:GH15 family glucan-1,4-alpha-glucosidase
VLEQVREGEASAFAAAGFEESAFRSTVHFWRCWIARSRYQGRWREMVNRSALVLKLLTSQEYGSLVAAPTFGLPEELGGERNWDYRFTWIRDASFTLYALLRLGFTEEAAQFMNWLERRCVELPDAGALQIMYGIDGRRTLTEEARCLTSRGMRAAGRCASATAPTTSSSSTSTAS